MLRRDSGGKLPQCFSSIGEGRGGGSLTLFYCQTGTREGRKEGRKEGDRRERMTNWRLAWVHTKWAWHHVKSAYKIEIESNGLKKKWSRNCAIVVYHCSSVWSRYKIMMPRSERNGSGVWLFYTNPQHYYGLKVQFIRTHTCLHSTSKWEAHSGNIRPVDAQLPIYGMSLWPFSRSLSLSPFGQCRVEGSTTNSRAYTMTFDDYRWKQC